MIMLSIMIIMPILYHQNERVDKIIKEKSTGFIVSVVLDDKY